MHFLDSKGVTRIVAFVAVSVLAMASGLGATSARASTEDLFSNVTTVIAPYSAHPAVNVDGKISPGEYDPNVTFTESDTAVSVSIVHDNESLFIGIQGPVWRWVALGVSSDGASTMGFVIVTRTASGFSAQERLVTTVAEDMTFGSASPGRPAIEKFDAEATVDHSVAELQLNLDSSMWSLESGVVYPTVIASNLTAPEGVPSGISGSEVHFMGSYLLRVNDSVKDMNDLLNGKISPVPGVVALVIIAVGVVAILTEFVIRRRKE